MDYYWKIFTFEVSNLRVLFVDFPMYIRNVEKGIRKVPLVIENSVHSSAILRSNTYFILFISHHHITSYE